MSGQILSWRMLVTGTALLVGMTLVSTSGLAAKKKNQIIFQTTTPSLSCIQTNTGGCGNNGHGNDPDHYDCSNPGNKQPTDNTDADGSPGNKFPGEGNCGASKS